MKVEADGVAPDGFYCTTNLPTIVRVDGKEVVPRDQRMDSVIVRELDGLAVKELNKLRRGDNVVTAMREDGSEGVYALSSEEVREKEKFSFMANEVNRERPIDYAAVCSVLERNRCDGYIIWVIGPAVIHSKSGDKMEWLIRNGYVDALFGGNAVAVHDIERALYGTTLGMDEQGNCVENGHRKHVDAINTVRKYGSIENAVREKAVTKGIMHTCVKNRVPYVLCGSIRDDGPLPDTITDSLASQDAMREHTKKATCAVVLATALHGIATGNMLPAYRMDKGKLRAVEIICCDQDEFVVNKLSDRGTSRAYAVVTNAQDFLYGIVERLKK